MQNSILLNMHQNRGILEPSELVPIMSLQLSPPTPVSVPRSSSAHIRPVPIFHFTVPSGPLFHFLIFISQHYRCFSDSLQLLVFPSLPSSSRTRQLNLLHKISTSESVKLIMIYYFKFA